MHPAKKNIVPVFIVLFLTITCGTFAQNKNPLINSGEVIAKGISLHDAKDYKGAIDEYVKVNRSDTNYAEALYELSYSCYADSQLERSAEYAKLGMSLFPVKYSQFSMQAANSLDDLGKDDEAITLYDSALKRNTNQSLLYFNRGLVKYRQEKFEEAKRDFQQCLLINPYYQSAHYFIAKTYMLQGNLVPAMLAFKTYLLIAPDGRYFTNTITALADISKGADNVLEYVKKKKAGNEDNFSIQQDILLSKLALDEQYKLKADLEDNIVRQIQVVDEKLTYNKNDKGFCMQFYVPFYIKTMKEGDFEPMIFAIFSNVSSKKIEKWLSDNKKAKQAFFDRASPYFDAIKRTRILDATERESSKVQHIYNNNTFIGKGEYQGDNPVGRWEYYYDNGTIKAIGSFNVKGNKEAIWTYYYNNGRIKEKSNTVDGVLNGLSEGWFDNGNKWYSETYTDGKLNGTQTIYFYNEMPKSVDIFRDDHKNGEEKLYNFKGELTFTANYLDDKLEGIGRSYFADGKIKDEVMYKNDLANGTYKLYYKSGKLNQQGDFKDGLKQGEWVTYYENGNVSEKTVYVDNEITGEFTEYFENGKLSRKGNYYKKKIDGKLEGYDDDGVLFASSVYDKGRLKEISFYDKSGKVISNTTTRKGAANIVFYSAEGLKTSEGFFNKEGLKEGKFVSYYNSGAVSEESNWKNGIQDGPQTTYYSNGKIKSTTNYKDGDEDGYINEFYPNGNLNAEGWKIEGKKQQTFIYYNRAGDLYSKEYYLNDELDGYSEYYEPGNKLSIEYNYYRGWLLSATQYDSTGKLMIKNNFEKGYGTLVYKNFEDKISSKGQYSNYMLHGPYTYYFFDGSVSGISFYKKDQRDSIYRSYHYGGKLRTDGYLKDGLKEGTWKYYLPDGSLREEENYKADNLDGVNKIYFPDGSIEKIYNYKDNKLEGNCDIYAEKGQLAIRLNYHEDVLKSYQFEEAPGKLTEPIPVKGANAKVMARYPNGKQSTLYTFVDNVLEGESKVFYPSGAVYTSEKRVSGYIDGPFNSYYPNGKPWKEENYIIGSLHGLCRYYYPNGKLEREENYYNDEKHGTCKYYDQEGKLKKTLTYYYGSLQAVK